MTKRIFSLMILSLLLACMLAVTAFGARTAEEARQVDPRLIKSEVYSFGDAGYMDYSQVDQSQEAPRMSLGDASASLSPGAKIGDTWYEFQRNGSMRRMITWGTHGTPDTMLVHMNYMMSPDATAAAPDRCYYYYSWNAAVGAEACKGRVQSTGSTNEKGGYVVVDVTNDNRGIPGGHYSPEAGIDPYKTRPYFDFEPGGCFFTGYSIPVDTGESCQWDGRTGLGNDGYIWPAIALQEGTDTILHVLAAETAPAAADPQVVAYFRNVNPENGGVWEVRCVDTIYDISEDIDCNDAGMVVITWVANRPCNDDPSGCDTCSCSGQDGYSEHDYVQWDNDIYYQVSTDGGANWLPRENVTKHEDECNGGNDPYPYRPYTSLNVLLDPSNDIHIVWGARYWPTDANCGGDAGLYRGRVFHYCPTECGVRTVHDANRDQENCSPNSWCLNADKPSISYCDGKLYTLFAQYNDIPGGVDDDCAVESNPGFPAGAANGDLWLCVSGDNGVTWDKARNLTKSYTPACSLDCADETYSSMARYGTNYSGNFSGANIVVPDDCTDPGTYYLDIMYVDDKSAGGAIQDQGWWALADVRWMRVPCCPLISAPSLSLDPPIIGYPTWTKHGIQKDVDVICENTGNAPLVFTSITLTQTDGPGGSLGKSNDPTTIPSGCANKHTMQVHINNGGTVNTPNTIVYLAGEITYNWAPSESKVLPIEAWVVDTLIAPVYDTISTSCLSLVVSNSGNFGHQGEEKTNMDYYDAGDCDTTATVYVYDGSPIIGYVKGGNDTLVSFSIFDVTYVDTSALRPVGDTTSTDSTAYYGIFKSGVIVTSDSMIAIEKIWYAPITDPDTCSFVIQEIRVYLYDDLRTPPTSVRIGEGIDFDIPADTGSRNNSGFDYPHNLIYQQGSEEDDEGCQPNDTRWGGIDFLAGYKNGVEYKTTPHGAYTKDNSTYVYPEGGFHQDSLFKYMANSGYAISDSSNADLHTVMTFDTLATLLPGDTYVYYVEIVTHWNGTLADLLEEVEQSLQFFEDYIRPVSSSCCKVRGDVDGTGSIDVGDLTYLVAYLFQGGAPPPCDIEGDVDGTGSIDVGDLTYLVAYLFQGGANPPPCT
ncbi:MAG: dockerin type I repeat-containing protein [bacterium]